MPERDRGRPVPSPDPPQTRVPKVELVRWTVSLALTVLLMLFGLVLFAPGPGCESDFALEAAALLGLGLSWLCALAALCRITWRWARALRRA